MVAEAFFQVEMMQIVDVVSSLDLLQIVLFLLSQVKEFETVDDLDCYLSLIPTQANLQQEVFGWYFHTYNIKKTCVVRMNMNEHLKCNEVIFNSIMKSHTLVFASL